MNAKEESPNESCDSIHGLELKGLGKNASICIEYKTLGTYVTSGIEILYNEEEKCARDTIGLVSTDEKQ